MNNPTTTQVVRQPGIAAKIAMVFAVGTMAGGGIVYSIAQRPREAQATNVPQMAAATVPPAVASPVQQPLVVQIITPPLPEGTRVEVRNAEADSPPTATASVASVSSQAASDDVVGEASWPLYGPPLPPGFSVEEAKTEVVDTQKSTVVSIPVPVTPTQPKPQPQSPQAATPVNVPTPPAPPTGFSGTPSVDNKVNINTATQAELELLPQVGPAMAKKILEYREKNGPFKDAKELDRIKGIGPKTLEKLLPLVTVKPDKPAR